jgi:hypothetical protein
MKFGSPPLPRISLTRFARSESPPIVNVRLQLRAIGEVVALVACSLVLHSLLRSSVGTVGSKNRDPLVVLRSRTSWCSRSFHPLPPAPHAPHSGCVRLPRHGYNILLRGPPSMIAPRGLRLGGWYCTVSGRLPNACGPALRRCNCLPGHYTAPTLPPGRFGGLGFRMGNTPSSAPDPWRSVIYFVTVFGFVLRLRRWVFPSSSCLLCCLSFRPLMYFMYVRGGDVG